MLNLRAIARQAMLDRGFIVSFPAAAQHELNNAAEPRFDSAGIRDLTSWLWSSIDNDDSRDLDQIEFAAKENGGTRIYIGVADVDWFVRANSAVVSGINADGTWVRITHPPVEGKLEGAAKHLDVGHLVHVRLVSVNPERGFIDFALISS